MADNLTKCSACNGRGYHNCECWPGDCICGYGDETCEECGGNGFIDPSYDYFDPRFDTPASEPSKGATSPSTTDMEEVSHG